jgi:hypothetical protein
MKSIILATSLMAVLASSKPLEKRYYVTETDTYTVTVTETGWGADATGSWGKWGQWSQSADPVSTTATSAAAAAWTPSSYSTPQAAASTPAPATTAPAASTWSSAPAASSAASSGSVSSYAQAILDQHNNHRSNHSANPLVWDDNMASIAQQIGASCVYAHNT